VLWSLGFYFGKFDKGIVKKTLKEIGDSVKEDLGGVGKVNKDQKVINIIIFRKFFLDKVFHFWYRIKQRPNDTQRVTGSRMFNSAKPNKMSEHIIEQIRKAIFEGQLKPGDRLPPEKELVKNFKVSKATLREALHSLEVLGFLEIRKGASGGPFVTEVDMKKAKDSFANFLLFKNLSLKDLSEVRLILEPYIAEKAASAITEEDLKSLEKLNKECDYVLKNNIPIESRKNEIEYHRTIGSVTGNPILMFILDFVENLLIDTKEILQPDKEFSQRVLNAHKRIYKALLERNPKKAREEMIKHVREVEKDLLALQKERTMEKLDLRRTSGQREFGLG
jgi:GntR family transcriptional repressor for pyruvate dehydrogenase complex